MQSHITNNLIQSKAKGSTPTHADSQRSHTDPARSIRARLWICYIQIERAPCLSETSCASAENHKSMGPIAKGLYGCAHAQAETLPTAGDPSTAVGMTGLGDDGFRLLYRDHRFRLPCRDHRFRLPCRDPQQSHSKQSQRIYSNTRRLPAKPYRPCAINQGPLMDLLYSD